MSWPTSANLNSYHGMKELKLKQLCCYGCYFIIGFHSFGSLLEVGCAVEHGKVKNQLVSLKRVSPIRKEKGYCAGEAKK